MLASKLGNNFMPQIRRGISLNRNNDMRLSEKLQLKLAKRYEPNTLIRRKYLGKGIVFKTDDHGNPVSLFLGRADNKGRIHGDRFVRTLKADNQGRVIKDHWDRKG